jgi:hypothetical protein
MISLRILLAVIETILKTANGGLGPVPCYNAIGISNELTEVRSY